MKSLMPYLPLLSMAFSVATMWIAWSIRQIAAQAVRKADEASQARDKILDDRIDAQVNQAAELKQRLAGVEDDIRHLPTSADVVRVEGEVRVVLAKVENANDGIRRLEGYALAKTGGVLP